MNDYNWESADGFVLPSEYQRFNVWLDIQIQLGLVEEVEVNKKNYILAVRKNVQRASPLLDGLTVRVGCF